MEAEESVCVVRTRVAVCSGGSMSGTGVYGVVLVLLISKHRHGSDEQLLFTHHGCRAAEVYFTCHASLYEELLQRLRVLNADR